MIASRLLGGGQLEPYLLARHRAIDALLERAIESDGITQVLEVACGLSPRGWRFATRYGDRITYVEADLPAMAARKRAALERIGTLGEHHRVEDVDALRDDGPESLGELTARLDRAEGLVIITEGLTGYLRLGAARRAGGRGSPRRCMASAAAATSPICIWVRARPSPSAARGWCCRRSSAVRSTCTTAVPPRPAPRWSRAVSRR